MHKPLVHRVVVLVTVCCACPRVAEEPVRVPQGPPRTLELLATASEEPVPPVTEPLRRDRCGVPLSLSPEGLMRPEGIAQLQSRLVDEALLAEGEYEVGALDEATLAAVLDLQSREGLPQVGIPTYATVRALGIEPDEAFRSGDETCDASP